MKLIQFRKVVKKLNKVLNVFKKIGSAIYSFLDKRIITPISRFIYFIYKKFKGKSNLVEKLLNRPNALVYLALIFSVAMFFMIDSQVITLVETEAEIIEGINVNVKYNKEAYVVEGLIEKVDIYLSGRKSAVYLAKQLGEHEVTLDLSDYEASDKPIKVNLSYNQTVTNIRYNIIPSYVTVTIKQKVSDKRNVTTEILNENKLNEKLSVKSIELAKTDVVVKGSQDSLNQIATVKALVDLSNTKFTEANTYTVDNVPLKAYDSDGRLLENVEIVPGEMTATVTLSTNSKSVPLKILTTGEMITGKAISSITINGKSSFNVDVYGEKSAIDEITNLPVTIDVANQGNVNPKQYTATLVRPSGIRSISTDNVKIVVTFGDEKQKSISLVNVDRINLADGLSANISNLNNASVTVKGVQSVIDSITSENISPYIDLAGYKAGTYEVDVLMKNDDPKVNYQVTSKITIVITNK